MTLRALCATLAAAACAAPTHEQMQFVPYVRNAEVPMYEVDLSRPPLFRAVAATRVSAPDLGAVAIEGVIRNRTDGTPVAGARVQLRYAHEEVVFQEAVTTKDGAYHFQNLPFASYDLEVQHPAGERVAPSLLPVPGGTLTHDFLLGPAIDQLFVTGVVRDESGRPVANALVLPVWSSVDTGGGLMDERPVHTDARGRYAVAVPDGSGFHTGWIEARTLAGQTSGGRPLPSRRSDAPVTEAFLALDLTLHDAPPKNTTVCEGRVIDAAGGPAGFATVTVDEGAESYVLTDKDGVFRVAVPDSRAPTLVVRRAGQVGFGSCRSPALRLAPGAVLIGDVFVEVPPSNVYLEIERAEDVGPAAELDPYRNAERYVFEGSHFVIPGLPLRDPLQIQLHTRTDSTTMTVTMPEQGVWNLQVPIQAHANLTAHVVDLAGLPTRVIACLDEICHATLLGNEIFFHGIDAGSHTLALYPYVRESEDKRPAGRGFEFPVVLRRGESKSLGVLRVDIPFETPSGKAEIYFIGKGLPGKWVVSGLQVEYVQPGGAAAAAGIEPESTLVSIDGHDLYSFEQALNLLEAHRGSTVNIVVRRENGSLNTVKFAVPAKSAP